jgi:glycerol-3-phosphate dehydrogenase
MTRSEIYRRLRAHAAAWDMIIVGGGATGAGVAIDAASRGYDVLLLEQSDFGKGTSSRSTKLVHGGVRYLEQGNLSLVMEAPQGARTVAPERSAPVRNLVSWSPTTIGGKRLLWDRTSHTLRRMARSSRILSREETLERLPTIKTEGLKGGGFTRRPVRRPPADQPGSNRL